MTQEEKQLLVKDLCARLAYSVWGLHRGEDLPLYVIDSSGAYMVLGYNAWFNLDTVDFKPYLRPMSSMTEEERKEIGNAIQKNYINPSGEVNSKGVDNLLLCTIRQANNLTNWLNEHHFDYRGLIEKSLAIVAPEDMYK